MEGKKEVKIESPDRFLEDMINNILSAPCPFFKRQDGSGFIMLSEVESSIEDHKRKNKKLRCSLRENGEECDNNYNHPEYRTCPRYIKYG